MELPKRKKIRLEGYDYASNGAYFVTICVDNRNTLSVIIGSMKRWVSKQIGFSIWQKSFNDRIIRNEKGYLEVFKYIDENPNSWEGNEK